MSQIGDFDGEVQSKVHEPDNKKFGDWVQKTQEQLAADPRSQPWKKTFGDTVDRGFDGEDWTRVCRENDVQHNSVAA